jgi:large-conductance mechanosensitive channel
MKIINFFDKLEDKIRAKLSRHPVIYALLGSIGIILLWRGIWVLADNLEIDGLISSIIGFLILLLSGLLVSFFVGEQIIISGIKEEKRIDEKTEEEIKQDAVSLKEIKDDIEEIKKILKTQNLKSSKNSVK